VKEGSHAAAKVHSDVLGSIIRADDEYDSTSQRKQVWGFWSKFNFGSEAWAAWPKRDTKPPENKKEKAETLKTLGEGVKALNDAGLPLDPEQLAEDYGLTLDKKRLKEMQGEAEERRLTPPPNPTRSETPNTEQLAGHLFDPLLMGQVAIDQLGDQATHEATAALKPIRDTILRIIAASVSYEDLRKRLLEAFPLLPQEKLRGLVASSVLLSMAVGRWSGSEERQTRA
jgi:Protein of unknown function (DUF935)